jgi:asparagine synthase (glutamine-hydrolysing)
MLTNVEAIADRTAQFLGVRFFKKHMNEQSIAEMFEDATWHCEQPFADLNFIGTYALSDLVREQGFRVLLNGNCRSPFAFSYLMPSRTRQ